MPPTGHRRPLTQLFVTSFKYCIYYSVGAFIMWGLFGKRSLENGDDEDEYQDGSFRSKRRKFDTPFPNFETPDGCLTEVSDDDEDESEDSLAAKEEKYRTKEDEDVAMFLSLAKRMSIKSLLHLLQGQARAQQSLPDAYLQQYEPLAETEPADTHMKQPSVAKQKKFRFAEVSDNQVRAVVHEVESYKEMQELWWNPDEMHLIRKDLIKTVRFFRRNRPEYIASVEVVAKATSSVHDEVEPEVEQHMKALTEDSYARGLESHVVSFLSNHRQATIEAVLLEQKDSKSAGDDPEMMSHCLMEQSMAYSKLSANFAFKMAKCDHIDALKASMSRWRASPPPCAVPAEFWDAV